MTFSSHSSSDSLQVKHYERRRNKIWSVFLSKRWQTNGYLKRMAFGLSFRVRGIDKDQDYALLLKTGRTCDSKLLWYMTKGLFHTAFIFEKNEIFLYVFFTLVFFAIICTYPPIDSSKSLTKCQGRRRRQ